MTVHFCIQRGGVFCIWHRNHSTILKIMTMATTLYFPLLPQTWLLHKTVQQYHLLNLQHKKSFPKQNLTERSKKSSFVLRKSTMYF